MGTRSEIGIQNQDGTIESIYCHWDGYPAHNGYILFKHYRAEEKVRELISYGDMSSLKEATSPQPRTKHSFDKPQKNICVYYHRDRGEKWEQVKPSSHSNIKEWEKEVAKGLQEYAYLFKNNRWYFATISHYVESKNRVKKWEKLTKEFLEREFKRLGWEW